MRGKGKRDVYRKVRRVVRLRAAGVYRRKEERHMVKQAKRAVARALHA